MLPQLRSIPSEDHDVAIIGAGVVGCAVARRFALAGAKVVVIEKGSDILSGASKANSAILHTGFDAPPGSLELELVKAGRAEYLAERDRLGLSIVETGALVCAWTHEEEAKLEQIAEQGRGNGVDGLTLKTADAARATVPGLSDRLVAALEVAGEHIIDPWTAPLAYLSQAMALGTRVLRNTELISGSFDGDWHLLTSLGEVRAGAVINTAGLYGDEVDRRLGFTPDFEIRPRKGQFVVLDKAAYAHVPRIILPVPTEITKGVVVCPTAFGNVLIGPTAEEQTDRVRATIDREMLQALLARGAEIVPALAHIPITAVYAGLRPATEKKHYRVTARPQQRAVTLGGIRSTGLSAALGLAQHALALHAGFGLPVSRAVEAPAVRLPNLTEAYERDWHQNGHGEIVCHCELVTKREVEAAFAGPLPAADFGGLKRRTRAGMGRCQGFYCNARLAALSEGRFAVPLAVNNGHEA